MGPIITKSRSLVLSAPLKILDEDELRQTAADKFYDEHHAAYEERAKPSRSRTDNVHRQHKKYPTLREELRKRKSLVKVASWCLNLREFDPNCSACTETALLQELKKRNNKQRCHCRRPKQGTSRRDNRDRCRGVTKSNSRRQEYKVYRFAYVLTDSGCQTTGAAEAEGQGKRPRANGMDIDDNSVSAGSYN